jgi:hypothetical protein
MNTASETSWEGWTPGPGPRRARSGIHNGVAELLRSGRPYTYNAMAEAARTNRTAAVATVPEMALAGATFEVEAREGKRVVPYRFRMTGEG